MTVVAELARGLLAGDRRALSKAITLSESSRTVDRTSTRQLLSLLGPPPARSLRVGVTGVPGAGKSTLLDALGRAALSAGERVAVLAIDPSSRETGGSLLGDKTRMTLLSADSRAFVRPSPTRGVLGGTGGRTREAIALCEAAGYGVVFIETVGVGQSEERVADLVDSVVLVLLAGAGDELSSMKRGVLEVASLIAFNKADGNQLSVVSADAAALRSSLSISRGASVPPVLVVSALSGMGVAELWSALGDLRRDGEGSGALARRRMAQQKTWFESALEEAIRERLHQHPEWSKAHATALQRIEAGLTGPSEAAQRLIADLLPQRGRSGQ